MKISMREKATPLRAMVAMSGGVDSSVAAYLMREMGFECVGVTMKLFSNEDIGVARDDVCCSLKDTEDARSVAYRLGIPHYVFNFTGDFGKEVIQRFVEAYENGYTPNPCVDCNRYVKFDRLLARAGELDYDFIVTGHYARIERDAAEGNFLLKKALDSAKDQSYFLYSMTQDQLARTLFPLGEKRKADVRKIAAAQGFLNAHKRESQDVCFVVNGNYADFIERYREKTYAPGNFIDPSGRTLGKHKGLIRYTIGQRRGLGVSSSQRLYVCGKNLEDNTIVLGDEKRLYSREIYAEKLNWISGTPPRETGAIRLEVKTGYRSPSQWATIELLTGGGVRIEFDEPQRLTAAGQAAVFYSGDAVAGGGTIQRRAP